jgi:hypothetical protein
VKIGTKREFYELWHKGLLGNRPRTWDSLDALLASGYTGTVTIRTKRGGGGKCAYRVPVTNIETAREWGESVGALTFNESMPDGDLVLQGEVQRPWELTYSTERGLPMREALKHAKRASGAVAQSILKTALSPASYNDMEDVWELYPDAVIEFSAYRQDVGDCRGRNAIVWEVRNY